MQIVGVQGSIPCPSFSFKNKKSRLKVCLILGGIDMLKFKKSEIQELATKLTANSELFGTV